MGQATAPATPVYVPPPVSAQPPLYPPAQVPVGAPMPPKSSGSPVVKIILIIVAVIVFIILIVMAGCVYSVYRAKKAFHNFEQQNGVTFPTSPSSPSGGFTPHTPDSTPGSASSAAVDMGSLQYPGATAKEGASMAMGGIQVQQYVTDDSFDKVLSFYKDKLGPKAMVEQQDGHAVVQVGSSNNLISVAITQDVPSGKTKFSITRFGK